MANRRLLFDYLSILNYAPNHKKPSVHADHEPFPTIDSINQIWPQDESNLTADINLLEASFSLKSSSLLYIFPVFSSFSPRLVLCSCHSSFAARFYRRPFHSWSLFLRFVIHRSSDLHCCIFRFDCFSRISLCCCGDFDFFDAVSIYTFWLRFDAKSADSLCELSCRFLYFHMIIVCELIYVDICMD